jgi:hypothetical protein
MTRAPATAWATAPRSSGPTWARPLDFAASASTDLIVSSLALLHYLENWDAPPRPELQEREPVVGRRLTTAPAFLFFRLTKAQAT